MSQSTAGSLGAQILDLRDARAHRSPGPKLTAMRRAGKALGNDLRAQSKVVSVRTLPLTTLLYPTTFAFNRAVPLPWPYVQMFHRCLLVQVIAEGEVRNILFNPTDYDASKATPFFAKMIDKVGERGAKLLAKENSHVDAQLAELGLSADDIDVVAWDHFHTQDLRPILGDGTLRARFPNAMLLAPRLEWEDWGDLHPLQHSWFVRDGNVGVPDDKVILSTTYLSATAVCS